jgi:hypothetical protein
MYLLPSSILLLLSAPFALTSVSTITVSETAPATPTSTSYTNDQTFQSDMLAATNFYRSEHGVAAVTWNATSAQYALNWSSKCVFKHSVCIYLLSSLSVHLFPHLDARADMKPRADRPAKIWQQATRTRAPQSTHGVSKESSITGLNRGLAKRRDISHSWFGAIPRVLAVEGRIARAKIVSSSQVHFQTEEGSNN